MKNTSIKVKDIMTVEPFIAKPTTTIQDAARHMKAIDCGVIPIGDSGEVVGIITDRDIAMRVVAEGKDPSKIHVDEVMTKKVYSCDEEDKIEDAAKKMREHNVVRLVVTKGGKVTGIVNAAELLHNRDDILRSDKMLRDISVCSSRKSYKRSAGGGCA
mgnify:CR=1 FL=1